MTKPYFDALKRLGLPPTDPNTAVALGVKLRQVQRYAAGELEPPLQVMLLLRCYLKHPALLDEVLAEITAARGACRPWR